MIGQAPSSVDVIERLEELAASPEFYLHLQERRRNGETYLDVFLENDTGNGRWIRPILTFLPWAEAVTDVRKAEATAREAAANYLRTAGFDREDYRIACAAPGSALREV